MKDNNEADSGLRTENATLRDAIEDVYEIVVLLDFYGQLLTKRQYDILDLHYNNDLSLGEIGEMLGISRQGVHDSIRKAKITLAGFEERLGLISRFREQEKNVSLALEHLRQVNGEMSDLGKNSRFKEAIRLLEKLQDNL